MMKNSEAAAGHGQEIEDAIDSDLADKVLKSVRKILLNGPSDTLKLQTKELQAPGAAHAHL